MKYTELEKTEKVLKTITIYDKKLTIAVDFDGTIIKSTGWDLDIFIPKDIHGYIYGEHKFSISPIDILKHWKSVGHVLILWTCREDNYYKHWSTSLSDSLKWLNSVGLQFDSVNENPQCGRYFGDNLRNDKKTTRKVLADWYIDDKSCNIEDIDSWNQNNWKLYF